MPYGFSGEATVNYLDRVAVVITETDEVHAKDPYGGYGSDRVFPVSPPIRAGGRQPSAHDGQTGHTVGTGGKANIVVSQSICEKVSQKVCAIDASMADELSKAAQQIKEMYLSIYSLPRTSAGVKYIEGGVNESIPEHHSLTDDYKVRAQGFTEEIVSIR